MFTPLKSSKARGFTLLEVLIAIAIFSLISMSSFSIFNTVLKSNESSKVRTDRVNELQRGFLLIERDLLQIAERSIRFNGEAPQEDFIYTDSNSFSDSESLFWKKENALPPSLL